MHTGDPQPPEPVPGVQSVRYPSLQGPGEKSATVVHHLSSPVRIYGHTAAGNHPGLTKHKREKGMWLQISVLFFNLHSWGRGKRHSTHTQKKTPYTTTNSVKGTSCKLIQHAMPNSERNLHVGLQVT